MKLVSITSWLAVIAIAVSGVVMLAAYTPTPTSFWISYGSNPNFARIVEHTVKSDRDSTPAVLSTLEDMSSDLLAGKSVRIPGATDRAQKRSGLNRVVAILQRSP